MIATSTLNMNATVAGCNIVEINGEQFIAYLPAAFKGPAVHDIDGLLLIKVVSYKWLDKVGCKYIRNVLVSDLFPKDEE